MAIYWSLAFILAGAIPQIANVNSFVGAACIIPFSYAFPPLLSLGFNIQKDAMLPEEAFNPMTNEVVRIDSGWARWARGYRKKLLLNTFNLVYFLGATTAAGFGIWASTTAMHEAFSKTKATPFTCTNPAG